MTLGPVAWGSVCAAGGILVGANCDVDAGTLGDWLITIMVASAAKVLLWEVLNWFDSKAAARVSGVAETVDYFGELNLSVPMISQRVLQSAPIISKRYLQFTSLLMYCTIYVVR